MATPKELAHAQELATAKFGPHAEHVVRSIAYTLSLKDGDKDWDTQCENCEATPTVHPLQLCGPCCFGEASTVGGNW